MSTATKEYIVTLKQYKDLDNFYVDMEEISNIQYIPNREVKCALKRPISRNTNYYLTDAEAKLLTNDPRVESVFVKIKGMSQSTNMYSAQVAKWSKSDSLAVGDKNWALYRCQLESNIENWGSESANPNLNTEISLTGTGKNVDIIVVDEILYPDHPEFSNRVNQYDWFLNHDLTVRGTDTTISNVSRTNNVSTITTLTPHKLQPGFIVDIICTSNGTFSASSVSILGTPSTTTFTYSNSGANVLSTSATGFWRGIYQYDNYTGANNHATFVAGIIAGNTQGWARESNLYNLRSDSRGLSAGEYTPPEYLIDYIRQFHANKSINPETGRKNPTIVNNSWGLGINTLGQSNPYTGNSRFSRINYQNNIISSSNTPVDTGISGVCSSTTKLNDINIQPNSGNRITTTSTPSATVIPITFTEIGSASLIDLGSPTASSSGGIDTNDDAIWQLSLPFAINYNGTTYQNNVYVSSNSYITFGSAISGAYEPTVSYPTFNKIFISAGDRNCETLYGNVFGTSPNRTYTVRYEGYDGAYGGVYESSPNTIWEMTFYEAQPTQIDVHVILNASYRGEFTTQELKTYGILIDSGTVPLRSPDIDADITDAIAEGIIFVGAAGNNNYKIDVEGGSDYDNFYVDNGLPIYYHRGSSPSASNQNSICVGEIGSLSAEYKSQTSNAGPRIDVYAPGTNITSSVYDNTLTLGDSIGLRELTISGGYAGDNGLPDQGPGLAVIVTTAPHELSNGDIVTIENCSNSAYNVTNVSITVVDSDSFRFNISDTGYNNILEILTGTVKINGIYQKNSGTSAAAAQITGLLAIALESYPWMNQVDAKNYITKYAKLNNIVDTQGSYDDVYSLQNGNNRYAYYHKERPSEGIVLPKTRQWLRPESGLVFPRQKIRKK